MIDLKLLQKDFAGLSTKLMRKGVSEDILNELKAKNETLKTAKIAFEELQAMRNAMSKEFGVYKREGKDINELKQRIEANNVKVDAALEVQREAQVILESLAMSVPNMPDDLVPVYECWNTYFFKPAFTVEVKHKVYKCTFKSSTHSKAY